MPRVLPPEGLYKSTIIATHASRTKKSGYPVVFVDIVLLEKVNEANPKESEPCPNIRKRFSIVVSKNTTHFAIDRLKMIGWEPEKHRTIKAFSPDSEGKCQFAGQTLMVYCKHGKDDKGEVKDNWDVSIELSPPDDIDNKLADYADALIWSHLGKDKPVDEPSSTPPPSRPTEEKPTLETEEGDGLPWS